MKRKNDWNALQKKLLLQCLKFEFVCVAVAPGGLDGCFDFTVKFVLSETARKEEAEGKEVGKGKKQMSACAF